MRVCLTLSGICAAMGIAMSASIAWADGEVHLRGAYYKERATRVVQPMTDIRADLGDNAELTAHFLIDSITSASVSSGAGEDAFTENRFEGGLGASFRLLDDYQFGLFGRYSNEPDYKSGFGGVRALAELAENNTTVAAAFGFGSDDISNAGAQQEMDMGQVPVIEGSLTTVLGSASVSQVLTPEVIAALTYDLSYLSGFQENAYRTVVVAGRFEPEAVPDTRTRHAIFGSVRGYIPVTRSTVIAGYRFYVDDWDIMAHTPEVRIIQELMPELEVRVRARYHRQSAASFFRERYDAPQEFVTTDVKLGGFSSQLYGVKLESALVNLGATGRMAEVRVDVLIEYVVQNNAFGNAIIGQLGVTIPFTN